MNWLPVDQEVQQGINFTFSKSVNVAWSYYIEYDFNILHKVQYVQEIITLNLKVFSEQLIWDRSLSYIGLSVWKKLPNSMKRNISLNTLKHDIKKQHLHQLRM